MENKSHDKSGHALPVTDEQTPSFTGVNDPLVGTQETTDSAVEAAGTPQDETVLKQRTHGRPEHSHIIAGLLGIFLGWLGVHRFYLGYYRVGAFQAALSILSVGVVFLVAWFAWPQFDLMNALLVSAGVVAVFALWGIFEGIAILSGRLRFDARLHPLS